MAGKSRRWISYEIKAGNLLALNLGNRGQRVPDWHLDPLKHELVQSVREAEPGRGPLADLPRAAAAACDAAAAARPWRAPPPTISTRSSWPWSRA